MMSYLSAHLKKSWVRDLVIFLIVILVSAIMISMRGVLAPVFLALAIAYVGDPVIDRLEAWKISRTWGIVILILAILLIMGGLTAYLLPRLVIQIQELAHKLPLYWKQLEAQLLPQLETYMRDHPDQVADFKNSALAWLQENSGILVKNVSTGLARSFKSVGAFLSNVLSLIIIPVLAFYLLRDFDIMKENAVKLIPVRQRNFVVDLFKELDQALGSFIKGQLLVALILSVIYSVGLTIAGCPGSLLIGILAGFANLVPYLGLALGLIPALLLTYLSGNPLWQVILAGMTFVFGQLLEGMVITPKVVGESVGLHPVLVLVALAIGGTYFGIVGMILALPVCAVSMVLARRLHRTYLRSPLYDDEEPAAAE